MQQLVDSYSREGLKGAERPRIRVRCAGARHWMRGHRVGAVQSCPSRRSPAASFLDRSMDLGVIHAKRRHQSKEVPPARPAATFCARRAPIAWPRSSGASDADVGPEAGQGDGERHLGRGVPEKLPSHDRRGEAGGYRAAGEALLGGIREEGHGRRLAGDRRRPVRLRAQHPEMHRLPALRQGLRRREQSVPRREAADRMDSCTAHGKGSVLGRGQGQQRLSARTTAYRSAATPTSPPASSSRVSITTRPDKVPEKDAFYFPMQCMQCEKPPCVKVCPVRTTYRDPDGIVVIDYNWCIGCRMCIGACPYWARRFNWGEPDLPRRR